VNKKLKEKAEFLSSELLCLDLDARVEAINQIRRILSLASPFRDEPVDCIQWVKNDQVRANDYNPNSVAPPEMALLAHSINEDGYTQPIVSWESDGYEVIDGFHRHRVGKENKEINERIYGYLPLAIIKSERQGRNDRIASTIRHNRARGKHKVDSMSEIVIELKRRNWTNSRICKELGMDEDEVLRLCQVTGLAELFSDDDFSKSWNIKGSRPEDMDFEEIDDINIGENEENVITMNTQDPNRTFHTYDKWECHKAGFYATTKEGMKKEECEQFYADFLADLPRFEKALNSVITEWKHSCEHYLSNSALNRIAWLGQASVCYESGIPSTFCAGFNLLTEDQQDAANNLALIYLNKWLEANDMETVALEDAMTSRTSVLY
jgi:ParB-like chromosome segregation protein Spo0J